MKRMTPLVLIGVGLLGALGLVGKRPVATSPTTTPAGPRRRVAEAAASQLGLTDASPYIEDALGYLPSSEPEWCGMFALWAMHQAGLLLGVQWEIEKGFAGKHLEQIVPSNLGAGDVVYFDQPYQHHAVVEWVDHERGQMSTINGNGAGGAVTRVVRPIADADAYYSIRRLVSPEPPLQRAA